MAIRYSYHDIKNPVSTTEIELSSNNSYSVMHCPIDHDTIQAKNHYPFMSGSSLIIINSLICRLSKYTLYLNVYQSTCSCLDCDNIGILLKYWKSAVWSVWSQLGVWPIMLFSNSQIITQCMAHYSHVFGVMQRLASGELRAQN